MPEMSFSRCNLHSPEAPADSFLQQHQELKLLERTKTVATKTKAPSELRNGIFDRSRNAVVVERDTYQAVFSYVNHTPRITQTRDLPPHCAATSEPLRYALRTQSVEKVAIILRDDPDQTFIPFAGGQPPICEAIKYRCELALIDLLIAHGADPSMPDCHGHSALVVLASIPRKHANQNWDVFTGAANLHGPVGHIPNFHLPSFNLVRGMENMIDAEETDKSKWILQVAERLLRAGCDPMECDPKGNSAEEVAAEYGWDALAELIRQWNDFKVCLVLHRSLVHGSASAVKHPTQWANLSSNLKHCIYQFVFSSNFLT